MLAVKIQTERFQMRTTTDFLETIDDWRVTRRPVPTRSEAIRLLVAKALQHEKKSEES